MNKQQTNIRTITLKDMWSLFLRGLWIILLAVLLAVCGLFAFSKWLITPKYESTATLYILRQNEDQSSNNATADFSLALNVVNDCTYLLKSHSVVDKVIDELSLDISYEALYDSISASNPENTRILEVTVKSDTPENAKAIVDSLCEIGADSIKEAMGFNQVNLYEYGTLNREPCNQIGMVMYVLVGMVVFIIVYSIFLLAFLLDDRLRTEEDIERYLGLSVLGDIPNANDLKKHDRYYKAGQ